MDQSIIRLYDEYTHAPLPRRVFLDRLAKLTGGAAAAMALLPILENRYAQAAIVAEDDPRLETSIARVQLEGREVTGYLAKPAGARDIPAVLVIHENRGLNPHIRDVTRRLALEGFLTLGLDALSPQGGTPENEDSAREMIGKLDATANLENYIAAVDFLSDHQDGNGMAGCVGFCWGGGLANQLAIWAENLDAAVAYYGRPLTRDEAPNVNVPLLLHYAGLDERINAGIPEFEEALKAKKRKYTIHMYDGVNHAFNNDTNEARYNKEAAELAWGRTVQFLRDRLKV
jgi:carboxymethylenebutenolidase